MGAVVDGVRVCLQATDEMMLGFKVRSLYHAYEDLAWERQIIADILYIDDIWEHT